MIEIIYAWICGFIVGTLLMGSIGHFWHNEIIKEYKIACLMWEDAYKEISKKYIDLFRLYHVGK